MTKKTKENIIKQIDNINNNESHPYLNNIDKAEGYFYAIKFIKNIIKNI